MQFTKPMSTTDETQVWRGGAATWHNVLHILSFLCLSLGPETVGTAEEQYRGDKREADAEPRQDVRPVVPDGGHSSQSLLVAMDTTYMSRYNNEGAIQELWPVLYLNNFYSSITKQQGTGLVTGGFTLTPVFQQVSGPQQEQSQSQQQQLYVATNYQPGTTAHMLIQPQPGSSQQTHVIPCVVAGSTTPGVVSVSLVPSQTSDAKKLSPEEAEQEKTIQPDEKMDPSSLTSQEIQAHLSSKPSNVLSEHHDFTQAHSPSPRPSTPATDVHRTTQDSQTVSHETSDIPSNASNCNLASDSHATASNANHNANVVSGTLGNTLSNSVPYAAASQPSHMIATTGFSYPQSMEPPVIILQHPPTAYVLASKPTSATVVKYLSLPTNGQSQGTESFTSTPNQTPAPTPNPPSTPVPGTASNEPPHFTTEQGIQELVSQLYVNDERKISMGSQISTSGSEEQYQQGILSEPSECRLMQQNQPYNVSEQTSNSQLYGQQADNPQNNEHSNLKEQTYSNNSSHRIFKDYPKLINSQILVICRKIHKYSNNSSQQIFKDYPKLINSQILVICRKIHKYSNNSNQRIFKDYPKLINSQILVICRKIHKYSNNSNQQIFKDYLKLINSQILVICRKIHKYSNNSNQRIFKDYPKLINSQILVICRKIHKYSNNSNQRIFKDYPKLINSQILVICRKIHKYSNNSNQQIFKDYPKLINSQILVICRKIHKYSNNSNQQIFKDYPKLINSQILVICRKIHKYSNNSSQQIFKDYPKLINSQILVICRKIHKYSNNSNQQIFKDYPKLINSQILVICRKIHKYSNNSNQQIFKDYPKLINSQILVICRKIHKYSNNSNQQIFKDYPKLINSQILVICRKIHKYSNNSNQQIFKDYPKLINSQILVICRKIHKYSNNSNQQIFKDYPKLINSQILVICRKIHKYSNNSSQQIFKDYPKLINSQILVICRKIHKYSNNSSQRIFKDYLKLINSQILVICRKIHKYSNNSNQRIFKDYPKLINSQILVTCRKIHKYSNNSNQRIFKDYPKLINTQILVICRKIHKYSNNSSQRIFKDYPKLINSQILVICRKIHKYSNNSSQRIFKDYLKLINSQILVICRKIHKYSNNSSQRIFKDYPKLINSQILVTCRKIHNAQNLSAEQQYNPENQTLSSIDVTANMSRHFEIQSGDPSIQRNPPKVEQLSSDSVSQHQPTQPLVVKPAAHTHQSGLTQKDQPLMHANHSNQEIQLIAQQTIALQEQSSQINMRHSQNDQSNQVCLQLSQHEIPQETNKESILILKQSQNQSNTPSLQPTDELLNDRSTTPRDRQSLDVEVMPEIPEHSTQLAFLQQLTQPAEQQRSSCQLSEGLPTGSESCHACLLEAGTTDLDNAPSRRLSEQSTGSHLTVDAGYTSSGAPSRQESPDRSKERNACFCDKPGITVYNESVFAVQVPWLVKRVYDQDDTEPRFLNTFLGQTKYPGSNHYVENWLKLVLEL
uniref:Uncharacterized protein n=1 Tax=Timema shepardi TaxID=629360 RepID=A0A7R9AVK6_TIMSH|nr:unnamed protein product [Timema shepardi]